MSKDKQEDLWLEFAGHGHCGLCGNTGIIDTIGRAITPAGVHVGVRAYCICPNGRAIKEMMSHKYPTVINWVYEDGRYPEPKVLGSKFLQENKTTVQKHRAKDVQRSRHDKE